MGLTFLSASAPDTGADTTVRPSVLAGVAIRNESHHDRGYPE